MLCCVDVGYAASPAPAPAALAACVCFTGWADATPSTEQVVPIARVDPYEPGAFYRRELPCLLQVLALLEPAPRVVIVDGYCWLDGGRPGLGAHLYEALDRQVAVVGVAKTHFAQAPAEAVLRGGSMRPLLVTAAGMPAVEAAAHVERMHGAHRIPTLLKRVDRLARGG